MKLFLIFTTVITAKIKQALEFFFMIYTEDNCGWFMMKNSITDYEQKRVAYSNMIPGANGSFQ